MSVLLALHSKIMFYELHPKKSTPVFEFEPGLWDFRSNTVTTELKNQFPDKVVRCLPTVTTTNY